MTVEQGRSSGNLKKQNLSFQNYSRFISGSILQKSLTPIILLPILAICAAISSCRFTNSSFSAITSRQERLNLRQVMKRNLTFSHLSFQRQRSLDQKQKMSTQKLSICFIMKSSYSLGVRSLLDIDPTATLSSFPSFLLSTSAQLTRHPRLKASLRQSVFRISLMITRQVRLFLQALRQKLRTFMLLIFWAWARSSDGRISPPNCSSSAPWFSIGNTTILLVRRSALRFLNLKMCSAWYPLTLSLTTDSLSMQSEILSMARSASQLLCARTIIFRWPALRYTSPSLRAAISLMLMMRSLLSALSSCRQFQSTLQSMLISLMSDRSFFSSLGSRFSIFGFSIESASTFSASIISGWSSSSLDAIESSESTLFQESSAGVMASLSSFSFTSQLVLPSRQPLSILTLNIIVVRFIFWPNLGMPYKWLGTVCKDHCSNLRRNSSLFSCNFRCGVLTTSESRLLICWVSQLGQQALRLQSSSFSCIFSSESLTHCMALVMYQCGLASYSSAAAGLQENLLVSLCRSVNILLRSFMKLQSMLSEQQHQSSARVELMSSSLVTGFTSAWCSLERKKSCGCFAGN